MPHSYWRWVRCGPNHPSPTLFALALQWAGIPIIRGSFTGTDAFFGPGYAANLVPAWLPALDGVVAKLQAGGRVADVGCGLGASSVLIAQAYPKTTINGSDSHGESIQQARK